jgi:hypothetical protein
LWQASKQPNRTKARLRDSKFLVRYSIFAVGSLGFNLIGHNNMLNWARSFLGRAIFLEAGAAIIFFGSLIHHPEIERYGTKALNELSLRGYEIPDSSDAVRVYPATTEGPFSSHHAGGWRPGVISLRENSEGNSGVDVVLRHELMHEVSFRTCKGKLPQWAEEAAAMDFSGELSGHSDAGRPTEAELDGLTRRVRIAARLDPESYRTLARLVAYYGWPRRSCAVSGAIAKLLEPPMPSRETGVSGILVSLISGYMLESQGDLESRYPPGSLLKIVYAAALKDGSPEAIGKELAASDAPKLLDRRKSFDPVRFRFLISPARHSSLSQSIPQEEMAGEDEGFWRQHLGERFRDGSFPLEANLKELAQILRAALLYQPGYFSGLSQNGFIEASTLYAESEQDKRILVRLTAMSKTGTVSDERSNPLMGHLMVAWPAENPTYLAVFRSLGIHGAATFRRASKILEEWSLRHPIEFGKVKVRLLGRVPRSSWEIVDECPSFEREDAGGWVERISVCGRFRVVSSARGSRSERFVSGILSTSQDGQMVVLETDAESYANAVLAAEAEELQGEARKALRAVIVWNGAHGSTRHEASSSLCDTTHCMVFQGSLGGRRQVREDIVDSNLLELLDGLAQTKKLDWLPFSKGGTEKWEKGIQLSELKKLVNEPSILDIKRERTRTGDIAVHLMYQENEEIVPCEVFRDRLKLLSCPETIRFDESGSSWIFSGIGEGHGEGLSVAKAMALAQSGHKASTILTDAYK